MLNQGKEIRFNLEGLKQKYEEFKFILICSQGGIIFVCSQGDYPSNDS